MRLFSVYIFDYEMYVCVHVYIPALRIYRVSLLCGESYAHEKKMKTPKPLSDAPLQRGDQLSLAPFLSAPKWEHFC